MKLLNQLHKYPVPNIVNKAVLISALIVCAILFASGWQCHKFLNTPEVSTIKVGKIQSPVIIRDYSTISIDVCIDKLKCFDTSPWITSYKIKQDSNQAVVSINATLCERSMKQEITIPIASNGNWKYYIAGGIVAGVVATALASSIR